MRSRLIRAAALLWSLGITCAGKADAHSLLAEPPPRDQQDGYKDDSACGVPFAVTQPLTKYAPGQTLNVQWLETVDHPGCFLIEFSAGGDQDFQILGRKSHSNPPLPEMATSAEPRHWSMDVTLPAAPCSGCTLRLRQLMLDDEVTAEACSPVNAAPRSIYTTCANIALESESAPAVTAPVEDGGCSVAPANDTSFTHALWLVTALGAPLLRRRMKGSARP